MRAVRAMLVFGSAAGGCSGANREESHVSIRQFRRAIIFCGFALGTLVVSLQAQDAQKNGVPYSQLSANVRQEAKQAFDAGRNCYIWRDPKLGVEAMDLPFGGKFLIIGPFYILSREEDEGIAFQPYFDFVALSQAKDSGERVNAALVSESVVARATSRESRSFSVMLPTVMSEKKYSGTASVRVYVARREGEKSEISNSIQIKVDFDAGKLVD